MKSINLFIVLFVSINIHAVDNLRILDMRSLGMGRNGVTQSALFNPALVALHTGKMVNFEYFNRYGLKELGMMGIGFIYPNSFLCFQCIKYHCQLDFPFSCKVERTGKNRPND